MAVAEVRVGQYCHDVNTVASATQESQGRAFVICAGLAGNMVPAHVDALSSLDAVRRLPVVGQVRINT
jgi:hypothetical protein